jgi:hypothetical protein
MKQFNRPSSHHGKRADLEDRYFRSSWEANYCRYLNWLISIGEIIKWEYEVDTFEFPVKKGNRFYTPDFKVYEKGNIIVYHEIKGYMDANSQTKLKRMAKYYPNIKVIVIDSSQYYAIARQVKNFIVGWETGA